MLHREILVGGYLLGGPCDQGIGKQPIFAPYDNAMVGTVAEGSWPEMDSAIAMASDAKQRWAASSGEERSDLLDRIATAIEQDQTFLAELLSKEVGKPIQFAKAEVERCAITFKLASDYARSCHETNVDTKYDGRGANYSVTARRRPVGVVMCIVPYNWPLNLAAHKIAPALATGNTVVLKCPMMGVLTSLSLARLIHESGVPEGVFSALNCDNWVAERAALDARVDMVSFTGSASVGWMLKEKLPHKRVSLELGGDAFAYVSESAELNGLAKRLATSAYAYAGQVCISLQNVLCHESRYEELKTALTEATESIEVGDPLLPATVCGPMIDDAAATKVMEAIDEAESLGATVLAGGSRIGRIVTPTLLEDVPPNSFLGQNEAFGPILTLAKVASANEAISRINRSQYGLQCSIFSTDEAEIQRFSDGVTAGGIVINECPHVRFDAMPYGGEKRSGFGREGIESAAREMTYEQAVIRKK